MSEKSKTLPAGPAPRASMNSNIALVQDLPDWVPTAVRLYLAHTEDGRSLRAIARAEGVHASTVLRQVRRFESRRDDPLIDHALERFRPPQGWQAESTPEIPATDNGAAMSMTFRTATAVALPVDEVHLMDEAHRLLPLLEPDGVVLVVAADMDKAVILNEAGAGSQRLAVLDRPLAEAFALRGWILCRKSGRVAQYALAPEGRALLRRLGTGRARRAREEARLALGAQGVVSDEAEGRFRPPPESPVAVLARRRDRDGQPFLTAPMVAAAERLREDFEVAQTAARTTQDWQRALTGRVDGGHVGGGAALAATPAAARSRVGAALAELGPGLGDVALRCCCWQEGIEAAERHLGWSARSGKVVLRIALDRLARHYAGQGEAGKLIG